MAGGIWVCPTIVFAFNSSIWLYGKVYFVLVLRKLTLVFIFSSIYILFHDMPLIHFDIEVDTYNSPVSQLLFPLAVINQTTYISL